MSKKVIITGATGIIGKVITQILNSRGDEVTVFSREPREAQNIIPGCKNYVEWDAYNTGQWTEHLSDKDAIIHLAGTSIFGQLWSDEYKKKILSSREEGTRNLVKAIESISSRPEVFISASAIGFYGGSRFEVWDENSPAGSGFLPEVSKRWEKEASEVEKIGVRRASIRIGIVLDKNDGALGIIRKPFRYIGGVIGSGEQWISWIHKRDVAKLFIHIMDNKYLNGAFNAVSPNPVQMKEFAKVLRIESGATAILNIPKFSVEALLGDAAVPVTEGIHVVPKRVLEAGYKYEFNYLSEALEDIGII